MSDNLGLTVSLRPALRRHLRERDDWSPGIQRDIDRESEMETAMSSGPAGSAHKSASLSRREKVVLAVIGVTAVTRMARDRRTYERVILVALALTAAAGIARAGQVRAIARLIAWDEQQTLAEQRRAEASRS